MNNKLIKIIIGILILITFSSFFIGKSSIVDIENTNKIVESNTIIKNIGVSEFKEKLLEDYIVIDVRTVQELEDVRLESMDLHIDYYESEFRNEIDKLDKEKKYLIYCRSGGRTGNTLTLMKQLGFKEVYDLKGGINSWIRAGEKTINGKLN